MLGTNVNGTYELRIVRRVVLGVNEKLRTQRRFVLGINVSGTILRN